MLQSSVSQRVHRSKRLVSIKDIAKEAGVSVCTVSLVMNNKDHNRVSKAVAQKIRAIAENMGYKPNSVARTLRTSKSNTLGFVTDEIATTPYAGQVLQGAQDAARETLASDPELLRPEHTQLKAAVARLFTLNADTLN